MREGRKEKELLLATSVIMIHSFMFQMQCIKDLLTVIRSGKHTRDYD